MVLLTESIVVCDLGSIPSSADSSALVVILVSGSARTCTLTLGLDGTRGFAGVTATVQVTGTDAELVFLIW